MPLGSAKGKLEDKYGKQPIENAGAAVLMLGKQTMRASAEGVRVAEENPKSELARLRKKQLQAQQDEVYGGFSKSKRAEYYSRAERINELELQLQTLASADKGAAKHRGEWNKKSETDTPQSGRSPALPHPRTRFDERLY